MTSLATLQQGALGLLQHHPHRASSPAKSQVTSSHRRLSPLPRNTTFQPDSLSLQHKSLISKSSTQTLSGTHPLQSKHTTRVTASASWKKTQWGVSSDKRGPLSSRAANSGNPLPLADPPSEGDKLPAQQAADTLALSSVSALTGWLLTAVPGALSEEILDSAAAEAAIDALPSWFGEFVVVIPLLAYALFFVIRARFNPRAGFLDFLFVFAAVVILANLFTSIVFQVRLY